jgi:hypothetical protein
MSQKRVDLLAPSLIGQANVVTRLQIRPELWDPSEQVREAKGGVAGNGALAVDNLTDPVCRDANLPRQHRRC